MKVVLVLSEWNLKLQQPAVHRRGAGRRSEFTTQRLAVSFSYGPQTSQCLDPSKGFQIIKTETRGSDYYLGGLPCRRRVLTGKVPRCIWRFSSCCVSASQNGRCAQYAGFSFSTRTRVDPCCSQEPAWVSSRERGTMRVSDWALAPLGRASHAYPRSNHALS